MIVLILTAIVDEEEAMIVKIPTTAQKDQKKRPESSARSMFAYNSPRIT